MKKSVIVKAPPASSAQAPQPFFIGIPVYNAEIVSKVVEIQQSLTDFLVSHEWYGISDPSVFKDAMIPPERLYLTLCTMPLKSYQEIFTVRKILEDLTKDLKRWFFRDAMEVSFDGVRVSGENYPSIVSTPVRNVLQKDMLTNVQQYLEKTLFNELGIPIDPLPFKPHLTFANVLGSKLLFDKRIGSFPLEIIAPLENLALHFGVERVHSLKLLQAGAGDPVTGHYQCFGDYTF